MPLISFETILLDCSVTAVISACIEKKTDQIGEFLYSHFNIEDKKRYTIFFGILCFILSRKVKTQLKHKKSFAQCMEKVLWWMECVRSSLQSFVLEISCWTMLHGQVDQLKLTNQIETLIENNQCYTMWETANILKISKS